MFAIALLYYYVSIVVIAIFVVIIVTTWGIDGYSSKGGAVGGGCSGWG